MLIINLKEENVCPCLIRFFTFMQNTLTLDVDVVLSEVMQVLDLMSSITIFKSLTVEHATGMNVIFLCVIPTNHILRGLSFLVFL